MSSDESNTISDADLAQQQVRTLLELIGFNLDGDIPADTVSVLYVYARSHEHVIALDNGVFTSHTIVLATVDLLEVMRDRKVGDSVASSLSLEQLTSLAAPYFAERIDKVPGTDIARGLESHQLVPIVAEVFDTCVDRAINKLGKQHMLDHIKEILNEALLDENNSQYAPAVRLILAKILEVEETLVNDADTDILSMLLIIESLLVSTALRSFLFGYGHHGYTAGSGFGPFDEDDPWMARRFGAQYPHGRRSAPSGFRSRTFRPDDLDGSGFGPFGRNDI